MDAAPDVLDQAVSIEAAAAELQCSPKTVRQWLRDDAPCVRQGRPGPGNGALVRVADLRRWRYGAQDTNLLRMGEALLDTQLRDAGKGLPAHLHLGIPKRRAAAHLLFVYDRLHRTLTGARPENYPEPIKQLFRIAETEPEWDELDILDAWTKKQANS